MYNFPNVSFGFPHFIYPYMSYPTYIPSQSNIIFQDIKPPERPAKLQQNQHESNIKEVKKNQSLQVIQKKKSQIVRFKRPARQKKVFQQFKYFSISKGQIGKNTRSNLLKYFMMYLKYSIQSTDKIEKIIQAHQLEIDKNQFKQMVQNLVEHTRYYFKPKHFGNLCRQINCSKNFAIIFRVLLRMFLKFDLPLFIRKSPRLKRKTKLSYLYISKKLQNDLIKSKKIAKRKTK